MRLDHQIDVPLGLDAVWQALNDPQRVAPCMPGATLMSVDGDMFTATVKVKIGPISMAYAGTGEYVARDDATHTLTLTASGKERNGAGRASATVQVNLEGREGAAGHTTGTITTDLTITGRAAQFGGGMITEVGGRILQEFSSNLTAALTVPDGSGDTTAARSIGAAEPAMSTVDPPEALDLLRYAAKSPIQQWIARLVALVAYPVVRLIGLLRRKPSTPQPTGANNE